MNDEKNATEKFPLKITQTEDFYNILWDKIESADGYKIYCKDGEEIFKGIGVVPQSDTPYFLVDKDDLSHGFFKVKAFRKVDGKKEYFSFSEYVQPLPYDFGLVVTSARDSLALMWNNIDGADGYRIIKRVDDEEKFRIVGDYTKRFIMLDRIYGKKCELKIKAYKKINDEKKFFASSGLLTVDLPDYS